MKIDTECLDSDGMGAFIAVRNLMDVGDRFIFVSSRTSRIAHASKDSRYSRYPLENQVKNITRLV